MDTDFFSLLEKYNYELPEELIAQEPAEPRDSARLLVYNRDTNEKAFDTFINLPKYLPKNAVLVFNQTKVLPARLVLQKPTGGEVKVLYVKTVDGSVQVMANKPLAAGMHLSIEGKQLFVVVEQQEKYYLLTPLFPVSELFSVLEKYGITPIPPYIKHSPLSEVDLREKYQTVFANENGSVAAPTASLHFTERLMDKIKEAGCDIQFATLHVSLGTFAPLTEEHVKAQKLHEEWYEISYETAAFLNQAKREGRPIIAVGTTVVRTLESAVQKSQPDGEEGTHEVTVQPAKGDSFGSSPQNDERRLRHLSGTTDLFISEGYKFQFIDGMITNFHVPKSSLLMLVAAFVGRDTLLCLYQNAIEKQFKFFSFGDGMLLL